MAKDKKDTENEAGEKVKKSNPLVSFVLLPLVLAVSAFMAVYFLPGGDEKTVAYADCPVPQEKLDSEAKVKALKEVSYVELDELILSLGYNQDAKHLRIGITLETEHGNEDTILYAQPKLRDAFTTYLRAMEVAQIEDPASMSRLRAQLLRRAQVVLGTETVQGVLITDFLVR